MRRIQRTGVWLSVPPSTVNGTELEAQEWRESLFLDIASSHLTCRPIVMAVSRRSQSATPWTARRAASSGRVTTISVMWFPTLQERPSPRSRPRRHQNIYQSRRAGWGGQMQSIREGQGVTAAGVGVGEGGPADLGSFDSGDGQHSRHVCREH